VLPDFANRKARRHPPNAIVVSLCLLALCSSLAESQDSTQDLLAARRAQHGCNAAAEAIMSKALRTVAGKVAPISVPWMQMKFPGNLEPAQVIASDGVQLNGYKMRCSRANADVPSTGYILSVQGDAMLATNIIRDLAPLCAVGFDVFVFDFRGYGYSGGKARLADIIADYREIVYNLNARGYTKHFIYGFSLGGAVMLNATAQADSYDALVVDSTPSKLPFFCGSEVDPVRHLPADSSRLLLITGGADKVVPTEKMSALIDAARQRGASIYEGKELCHPLMCNDRERFAKIVEFFKGRE